MDQLLNALLSLAPALVVFATAYLLLKEFFYQESKKRETKGGNEGLNVTLPIRLQAYERIVLFLERINPNQLVMRLMTSNISALELHSLMLKTIQEEYNHNLSQQLYVSGSAWELVKSAKEKTIAHINSCLALVGGGATSTELSQKILESDVEKIATNKALNFVKEEAKSLFKN